MLGKGSLKRVLTGVLIAVIVLLAVTAAVLGAVVYYQENLAVRPYRATGAVVADTTETQSDDEAAEEGALAPPPSPAASPETVTEVVTPENRPAKEPGSSAGVSGLASNGWSASSATRCAGGEELMFAGQRGGADFATICRTGSGEMIYRGDVFGGQLRSEVDENRTSISGEHAYVPANPATIVIDGAQLKVVQDGAAANSLNFDEHWWR